ncbi:uncharacterized protein LOC108734380 isoform X2 [Agrilus planipennis]|uniref:Uncharacterized protein LOC108734380 isoform X1 n=1 Tax=Agrilus planipennis TaxID=224129 RepID=A0A1W4WBR3_AGRPL|nr:uncharacterized protein LOC108734380 isoform X1 [Agrilus planipennis]XP_018321425.1 uncharacterized protein LOC108734380 isoform X1 [Agrilus planipennis]XP_018321427.1 uncharacterized protein LOC108734380 isoform X2 [Agrilus planipennis]
MKLTINGFPSQEGAKQYRSLLVGKRRQDCDHRGNQDHHQELFHEGVALHHSPRDRNTGRECSGASRFGLGGPNTRNLGISEIPSLGNSKVRISKPPKLRHWRLWDSYFGVSGTQYPGSPDFRVLGLLVRICTIPFSGVVPDGLRINKTFRAKPGRREKFFLSF